MLLGVISPGGESGRQDSGPAVLNECNLDVFGMTRRAATALGLAACKRKSSPLTRGAKTEAGRESSYKGVLKWKFSKKYIFCSLKDISDFNGSIPEQSTAPFLALTQP